MAAQNVPVPDTSPEEEFDLFGPGPDPGTAPAASSAAASSNPPRHLPHRQHLRPVVRLLLVCRQVEVQVAVVQLETETRLLSLSVCCDSHCNRTSR